MKVLELAPYLWCPEVPGGSRNVSGLAYMVRDIADGIGERADVAVLTQSYFVNAEKRVGSFKMAKRTRQGLVRRMSPTYLKAGLDYAKFDGGDANRRLRLLAYFSGGSYAERVIRDILPDVAHVHTMSGYTLPFLMACRRMNVPCVVTLHGLVSLDREATQVSDAEARLERLLMEESDKNGLPVTMIASGMKERMGAVCGSDLPNVCVVGNFCGRAFEEESRRRRSEGNITPGGRRRVLCVGSLGKRKNQRMAIEAIGLVKGHDVELRIAGDGPERGFLEKLALFRGADVRFLGQIDHGRLVEEYVRADLLVMPSLSEGFGLPVLEAYWYGVPAVAFSDQDAFADLYDRDCMVGVGERSVEALVAGLEEALGRTWVREAIFKKAQEFSSRCASASYAEVLAAGGAVPSEEFLGACVSPDGRMLDGRR